MSRYDHLPIFKSTYELCLLSYKLVHNFGKDYRYTLGERMKKTTHDMLDLLIETNSVANAEKVKPLGAFMLKCEQFRMYTRVACDLKILAPQSMGKVAEIMEEIGRQAEGWKSWVKKSYS